MSDYKYRVLIQSLTFFIVMTLVGLFIFNLNKDLLALFLFINIFMSFILTVLLLIRQENAILYEVCC